MNEIQPVKHDKSDDEKNQDFMQFCSVNVRFQKAELNMTHLSSD